MCAYQGVNSTEELTTRRAEANRNFQDFLVTEGQKKKRILGISISQQHFK